MPGSSPMNRDGSTQDRRYPGILDSDWPIYETRALLLEFIRSFFSQHCFLETDVPALTPYPTLDTHIRSLHTVLSDEAGRQKTFFLHTSPEHAMKKLLAAGADRVYFLGKVFRDRELTRLHNPEFTMLEWYRTHASYTDIQNDVESLISGLVQKLKGSFRISYQNQWIDFTPPWPRVTVRDLFLEIGVDIDQHPGEESLRRALDAEGLRHAPDDDWEILFDRLLIDRIEPKLGVPKPVFVTDYPASLGLMARRKSVSPEIAERVELYIAGIELANGYSELLDPEEQSARFDAELKKKEVEGFSECRVDKELLLALERSIPPSAGISVGVDRLVMILTDRNDIRQVLYFPAHHWMD